MSSGGAGKMSFDRLGEYRILREVGRGAMGIVYEAEQESLRRRVAVKVLPPSLDMDDERVLRFRREAEAAASLSHPNLVTVYGVGFDEGVHYIAMEFLEGEGLDVWIRRCEGGLPIEDVVTIGIQVATALGAMHAADILHRDIKPSNLMVLREGDPRRPTASGPAPSDAPTVRIETRRGASASTGSASGLRIKVTDFGLAKPQQDATLTASGVILGTPMYMPPEQVRGITLDGRADLYALGMVLYEASTSYPPFLSPDYHQVLRQVVDEEPVRPRRRRPSISRDLETVILKATEKDRDRRYANVGELEDDLLRTQAGEPVRARVSGPFVRLLRRAARYPLASAAVVLAVVLGAVMAGVGIWQGGREAQLATTSSQRKVDRARDLAQAERLVGEADGHRREGRPEKALRKLEKAVDLAPRLTRAWIELAGLRLEEGDAKGAAQAAGRAVDLADRQADTRTWRILANAEAQLGHGEKALVAIGEAIGLSPEDPEPLRVRAKIREGVGDIEGSLADLQAAEELAVAERMQLLGRADNLLAEGRLVEALRRLAAVVEGGGDEGPWRLRRGLILEALARDPRQDLARTVQELRDLGMPVELEGRSPIEALRACARQDLEFAGGTGAGEVSVDGMAALARLALARDAPDESVALWKEVLEKRPKNLEALRAAGDILFRKERWGPARHLAGRILEQDPEDGEARFRRAAGRLYESMGASRYFAQTWSRDYMLFDPECLALPEEDCRAARSDLEAAVAAGYDPDRSRLFLAATDLKLGDADHAREIIESLLAERPEDLRAMTVLIFVHLVRQDVALAEEAAQRATQAHPTQVEVWMGASAVAARKGDADGERRALGKVMELVASDPDRLAEITEAPAQAPLSKTRFGIALEDLFDGYARFADRDLGAYLKASASEDARVREMGESILWREGPAAILALERAAKGPAGIGEPARALLARMRETLDKEEEAVVGKLIRRYKGAIMTGNMKGMQEAQVQAAAGGPRLAEVLIRVARKQKDDRRAFGLILMGPALGSDVLDGYLDLLRGADDTLTMAVLQYVGVALSMRGGEPPKEILDLLDAEDARIRSQMTLQLAPILDRRLEAKARRGLREGPEGRIAYALSLYLMDAVDSVDELTAVFREADPDDPARNMLLRTAWQLDGKKTLPLVREVARRPEDPARQYALEGIGFHGGPEDVEYLISLLSSDDKAVAGAAAKALGRIGDPRAVEPLSALLGGEEDSGPILSFEGGGGGLSAAWALSALGRPEGLARVREEVRRGEMMAGVFGIMALLDLGATDLAEAAVDAYRTSTGPWRSSFLMVATSAPTARQVPALLEILEAEDAMEASRALVLQALAKVGDPRAIPVLERLLAGCSDEDTQVNYAWVLSRCGKVVDVPGARKWLDRRAGHLMGIELLARAEDPEALGQLRRILHGEIRYRGIMTTQGMGFLHQASLRFHAAEALAYCGDREALRELAGFLTSRDLIERRVAWQTLRGVTGREVEYRPLAPMEELKRGRKAWEDALAEPKEDDSES